MFDAKKTTEEIIEFIKDYYSKYNLYGVVLGISGGKDSGVVAGLFVKALGADKVIGVTLPCHSKYEDKNDAKLVSDYYGFKLLNLDLTNTFDTFKDSISYLDMESIDSDINLKPRLRMASLYYIAQLYTTNTKKPYLVAGTSNKCELYVGYFTKGGDNVHDISVLGDLTVDEVIKVGEYLNVPSKVLYKAPADGLSNLTDEDKLGVSYKNIASYIENGTIEDKDAEQKIISLHNRNQHKFNIPTYRKDQHETK